MPAEKDKEDQGGGEKKRLTFIIVVKVDVRQLMIYFANTFNTGIDRNISLAGSRLFSSNSVNTCQKIALARPLEELSS